MEHLPDACITTIQHYDYFKIDLPVTAFGYATDMIMQLSVEYGKNSEGGYGADIWACEKYSPSKHLIYVIKVPDTPHPDEAIVAALNESDEFYEAMRDYIYEAAKHR